MSEPPLSAEPKRWRVADDDMESVTVRNWPTRHLRSILRSLSLALVVVPFAALTFVILSSAVPSAFGYKTLIVTSGSMEPVFSAGDAIVIEPLRPDQIEVGDLATFSTLDGQGSTTHRVVGISRIKGQTYFQTKGDANETPDANLVPAESAYGVVVLSLPKLGYMLHEANRPALRLALVALPLLVFLGKEVHLLLSTARARQAADGSELAQG